MKTIIFFALAVCCNAANLNRNYLPPSFAQSSGDSEGILEIPKSGLTSSSQGNQFNAYQQPTSGFMTYDGQVGNGFESQSVQTSDRPQAAFERNAAILRQESENDGEKYAYSYETENGIYAEEKGVATNGVRAQGGFSYIGDDGKQYSIRYVADENGFQPQGDHIPTSPPIPEEILKALEQNARDEAAGIYDDGSYNENKYGDNNGIRSSNGYSEHRQELAQTGAQGQEYDKSRFNTFEQSSSQNNYEATSRTYLPPRNY